MSRRNVDFSKHILLETHYTNPITKHNLDVWDFKLPDSEYTNRVTFINSCGVLTVTGDFANWVFDREFHPSPDGFVSDGYWAGKLRQSSQQESSHYDAKETEKELLELIESGLEEQGYKDSELFRAKEFYEELLNYVDDEIEYTYHAYRDYSRPDFLDHEDIPFCKSLHTWLEIVFDAFDYICKRLKEDENKTA